MSEGPRSGCAAVTHLCDPRDDHARQVERRQQVAVLGRQVERHHTVRSHANNGTELGGERWRWSAVAPEQQDEREK